MICENHRMKKLSQEAEDRIFELKRLGFNNQTISVTVLSEFGVKLSRETIRKKFL